MLTSKLLNIILLQLSVVLAGDKLDQEISVSFENMTENNVNWDPEKGAKEPSSETPAAPPIYNIPLTPPPQVTLV